MALLDVTEILTDPDFADDFPVKRRAESVGQNGRSELQVRDMKGVGVICAASPSDLERLPEDQRMRRTISIVTQFRLQGPSPGYQADLVGWQGDFFVIVDIQPYTNYGAGFVQALASSMSSQDAPPPAVADTSDIGDADDGGEPVVGA